MFTDRVEYRSYADKAARYPAVTLEVMRRKAQGVQAGTRLWRYLKGLSLADLYLAMQAGAFVEDAPGGDTIRHPYDTLRLGGDCDDWAVVTATWAHVNGVRWQFMTCGDERDAFQHVYVRVFLSNGAVVNVDPQPVGMPLGKTHCAGTVTGPRLAPVTGSGSATVIGSWAALDSLVAPIHQATLRALFSQRFAAAEAAKAAAADSMLDARGAEAAGQSRLAELGRALTGGYAALPLSAVQALVPEAAGWKVVAGGSAVAGDVVLRSWGDIEAWLTPEQRATFFGAVGNQSRVKALRPALDAGTSALLRSDVLAWIAANVGAGLARPLGTPARLAVVQTLEAANLVMASRWLAGLPDREAALLGEHFGARSDISADAKRAVAAAYLSLAFSGARVVFDDWVQSFDPRRAPDSQLRSSSGSGVTAAAVSGSGSVVSRLVTHPLKVLRELQTDVGAFIRERAADILNAERNAPWLSNFVLKPLLIHAHAAALYQTGRVIEGGSVRDWDDRAMVGDLAKTAQSAGQALVAAGPFLPPPYNVAAVAVGAGLIAVGNVVQNHLETLEYKEAQAVAVAGNPQAPALPAIPEGFEAVPGQPGYAVGQALWHDGSGPYWFALQGSPSGWAVFAVYVESMGTWQRIQP